MRRPQRTRTEAERIILIRLQMKVAWIRVVAVEVEGSAGFWIYFGGININVNAPKAQFIKEKIDKLNFIKMKNCTSKGTIKMERQAIE